jgi:hypothetical protein
MTPLYHIDIVLKKRMRLLPRESYRPPVAAAAAAAAAIATASRLLLREMQFLRASSN